ncbi:MAG: PaaI family thioesterase [Aquincola tertiaricarbonis]
MSQSTDLLALLRAVNATAAFNRWCGIEVIDAGPGTATIAMPWRPEAGQYAGFLHAGLVGALIDTSCGFAAATVVGKVLASHYAVNCLRPAVGERFIARARVVKPGRHQVFTACELFAESGGNEKLVATGETILLTVAAASDADTPSRLPPVDSGGPGSS